MPPLSGEVDLCEIVESKKIPQITAAINALGISPAKCPVASVSKKYFAQVDLLLSLHLNSSLK